MKHNKTRNIFIILGTLIVLLLIGIFWQLRAANQPANQAAQSANSYQKEQESEASSLSASSSSELTEKQKKFRKELAKAPKGHYLRFRSDAQKVYRTTWTKKQVEDYVAYIIKYNHDNADKLDEDPFVFKDFGTNSSDFKEGSSFVDVSDLDLAINPDARDHSQSDFKFYFNSPKEVANDEDVQEYATELEY